MADAALERGLFMMTDERRRAPERDPQGGIPHTALYPLIGLILGIGSPVGAFLLRFILADPLLKEMWVRSELAYNSLFYWYMGIGSISSFLLFGWVLGQRSERQRVRNAALRRRVQELHLSSVTDGLTGAFSHAYIQETLNLELEQARRHRRPVSVLMLDLDDFKTINDTHGHLFGDRVLKELTETVAMNIRQADVLGRYGGEEFIVLMPGADAETSVRVAERVRQAVARTQVSDEVSHAGEAAVRLTVSIGAATSAGGGDSSAVDLIRRADENLYRAKRGGKNRTVAGEASHPKPARK